MIQTFWVPESEINLIETAKNIAWEQKTTLSALIRKLLREEIERVKKDSQNNNLPPNKAQVG